MWLCYIRIHTAYLKKYKRVYSHFRALNKRLERVAASVSAKAIDQAGYCLPSTGRTVRLRLYHAQNDWVSFPFHNGLRQTEQITTVLRETSLHLWRLAAIRQAKTAEPSSCVKIMASLIVNSQMCGTVVQVASAQTSWWENISLRAVCLCLTDSRAAVIGFCLWHSSVWALHLELFIELENAMEQSLSFKQHYRKVKWGENFNNLFHTSSCTLCQDIWCCDSEQNRKFKLSKPVLSLARSP